MVTAVKVVLAPGILQNGPASEAVIDIGKGSITVAITSVRTLGQMLPASVNVTQ